MEDNDLPLEFRKMAARERREAKTAAQSFITACKNDEAENMRKCAYWLSETTEGWPIALDLIIKLGFASPLIQNAWLSYWIDAKGMMEKVHNRSILAQALQILFSQNYGGPAIELFRGARAGEESDKAYGFCWSVSLDTARDFAQGRQFHKGGAVVLRTVAAPAAILHVRVKDGFRDDEEEVILNPFKLADVCVLARFPQTVYRHGVSAPIGVKSTFLKY